MALSKGHPGPPVDTTVDTPVEVPVDVDAVARAVADCRGVARLTAGSGVEMVSYRPGRKVTGVRVGSGGLEVHVVAHYGPTMGDVATEIRAALVPLLGDAPVSVVIHDLEIGPVPRR